MPTEADELTLLDAAAAAAHLKDAAYPAPLPSSAHPPRRRRRPRASAALLPSSAEADQLTLLDTDADADDLEDAASLALLPSAAEAIVPVATARQSRRAVYDKEAHTDERGSLFTKVRLDSPPKLVSMYARAQAIDTDKDAGLRPWSPALAEAASASTSTRRPPSPLPRRTSQVCQGSLHTWPTCAEGLNSRVTLFIQLLEPGRGMSMRNVAPAFLHFWNCLVRLLETGAELRKLIDAVRVKINRSRDWELTKIIRDQILRIFSMKLGDHLLLLRGAAASCQAFDFEWDEEARWELNLVVKTLYLSVRAAQKMLKAKAGLH